VKDAVVRYRIRHRRTFGELAKYLVSNFACEFTFNKLKNITNVKNIHTVKNYVEYLSSNYLVFVLERYSPKLKSQILAPKKIYCIDSGIANSIGFSISENKGSLMENLVASELFRRRSYWNHRSEIYYWKDHQHHEVDFVLKEGTAVKQLIQVCYDISNQDTRNREFEALFLASKQLKCNDLILINMDVSEKMYYKDVEINCISLWEWLL
jgi:predicted AAA+ superfamily ATPase